MTCDLKDEKEKYWEAGKEGWDGHGPSLGWVVQWLFRLGEECVVFVGTMRGLALAPPYHLCLATVSGQVLLTKSQVG